MKVRVSGSFVVIVLALLGWGVIFLALFVGAALLRPIFGDAVPEWAVYGAAALIYVLIGVAYDRGRAQP